MKVNTFPKLMLFFADAGFMTVFIKLVQKYSDGTNQ